MAVLSAKGKSISTKKSSSSSKASSIGSVVSGNWGVGSTYSNTGNTVADKAVRESTGQSAQSSANDIEASKAAGTHQSNTNSDRLTTSSQPVTTQNQVNTQPAAQTWTTATTPQTVEGLSLDGWNKKNLAQQKLWMKMHPEVDISKFGWEVAKSAWAKIAEQNTQPAWEWLWPKPNAAPTAPPAGEAPQWPDFQDKSATRLAEIAANLEAAYQQTPSVFKSRELFDLEFDYAKRSQSQKAVLDDFYKRKAQESLLNSTSAEDIVSSIASGKTSLEKYNLLKDIDPVKYTAVQDGLHQAQNQMKQQSNVQVANATLSTGGELTIPPEMEAENIAIAEKINSTAEDYKAAVNDPDLMAKRDELTQTMSDIDQMDKDIMRVKQEVEAQYPWVPRSQLNAIIADRTDKYRIERGDALIKANTLQGFINNRLDEAQLNYQVDSQTTSQLMSLNSQKLQQLWFAFQVKQYNEAPARAKEQAIFEQGLQQENAVFNSNLQVQQQGQLMEQEYEFANPDWDSPDPAVQERALEMSVNRLYDTYWDIIQRSPSQVVADVKKYAAENWVSLSQAMQENFVKQLQEKPQFKQMQNAMVGISNDPNEGIDYGVIWYDKKWNPIMWWIDKNNRNTSSSSWWGGGWLGWGWSDQEWMRTDRNNNPTAMTTDVAKSLWLVEWVDYEVGDPFTTGSWSTLYTARLLGDPIETTIKWLDIAANNPKSWAFFTWWGMQRWTHTAMSDEEWLSLDDAWKKAVVTEMYRREWGNWSLVWEDGISVDLSPLAKVALDSKTVVGTPTQKAEQIEELQEAWVFDKWEGNANFYLEKAETKTELWTLLAGYEKWSTAYKIFKKWKSDNYSGWFDNMVRSGSEKVGAGNSDAITLNNILSKELSTYMQRISGATVPKEEVGRLRDQIPNLNMGDKQFKTNMETYNTDMTAAFNRALTTYWFDSIESMRSVLGSTPADIDADVDPFYGQLQITYPSIWAWDDSTNTFNNYIVNWW